LHGDYIHARNDEGKGKGKGHDLNMAGVFLHVLGDAVGNIGVIASARFIWLTQFSWRFYTDPLVSIIITAIILHSAIPLCTAASRILLQAVPEGINVNEIKQDITTLPGVADYHALHVWQLSDTDVIATVHIEVDHKVVKDSHEQYI
ncbi:Zinc resistance conferring protein, partial [Exophiala xenobiotica]